MKTFVTLILALLFTSVTCYASVKTIGSDESLRFDPAGIPTHLKGNFEVLNAKCKKCHTHKRTVLAVTTGLAPITGQAFDRSAVAACAINMQRRARGSVSKEETKAVVELLSYLIGETGK